MPTTSRGVAIPTIFVDSKQRNARVPKVVGLKVLKKCKKASNICRVKNIGTIFTAMQRSKMQAIRAKRIYFKTEKG